MHSSAEPMSRKQQRTCKVCRREFNTWGMQRDKCLMCDPIPPKFARIYREQIQRDDPMVRL